MLEQVTVTAADPPFFAGIDVGGTNTKIGIVDSLGRTIAKMSMATDSERGIPDAIQRMANSISAIQQEHSVSADQLVAIGLATPGTMDLRAGMILTPPNLPGWRNFPIRDALKDVVGKPVTYANDATAAGFGEYWVGSGRDHGSLVLLTLGTGVGAGIILGGKTIDGSHDHGSEVGHVPIAIGPDARACPCGQRGHVEAYCSATAVVKRTDELLVDNPGSSLQGFLHDGAELSARLVFTAATKGDRLAQQIIHETAEYLAVAIVSVAHTIDPEIVVLGGAMDFGGASSSVGQTFLEDVRTAFRRQAFPILAEKTVIDFAQLGGDAGYIGAAGLAREAYDGRMTRIF